MITTQHPMAAKPAYDALAQAVVYQEVKEAAEHLNQSMEMQHFWNLIETIRISDENRETLLLAFNSLLNDDIEHGLRLYAVYLGALAADPAYEILSSYLTELSQAVIELDNSLAFKRYVSAMLAFEKDASPEAEAARGHLSEIFHAYQTQLDQA